MSDVGKFWSCLFCAVLLLLAAGAGDLYGLWDIPFWPVLWCSVYIAVAAFLNMICGRLVKTILAGIIGAAATWGSWQWNPFAFWLFLAATAVMVVVAAAQENNS